MSDDDFIKKVLQGLEGTDAVKGMDAMFNMASTWMVQMQSFKKAGFTDIQAFKMVCISVEKFWEAIYGDMSRRTTP